jgi:hypothetical protein
VIPSERSQNLAAAGRHGAKSFTSSATAVVADRLPRRRTPANVSFTRFFVYATYGQHILAQMVPQTAVSRQCEISGPRH